MSTPEPTSPVPPRAAGQEWAAAGEALRRSWEGRYERIERGQEVPAPSPQCVDVALLDMTQGWPKLGHDSLVQSLLDDDPRRLREERRSGLRVRVLSFDVRRGGMVPEAPQGGRFAIYLGTGGPGHIDPWRNDGVLPESQGVREFPPGRGRSSAFSTPSSPTTRRCCWPSVTASG